MKLREERIFVAYLIEAHILPYMGMPSTVCLREHTSPIDLSIMISLLPKLICGITVS